MFDEEDCQAAPLDRAYQIDHPVDLLFRHAGGRLIQEEEFRLCGQGPGNLEQPPRAIGEALGQQMGLVGLDTVDVVARDLLAAAHERHGLTLISWLSNKTDNCSTSA